MRPRVRWCGSGRFRPPVGPGVRGVARSVGRWSGCGREPAGPLGRRRRRVGATVGASQQRLHRLGDLGFRGVGQLRADVVPGQFPERQPVAAQVCPECGDPAAGARVTHPDPGHVVGVVVDLPQVLVGLVSRRLPAQRVELIGVVGAAPVLDAVGVDRLPAGRQQGDVVLAGQRNRQVAGRLDQRGVLLVRREHPSRRRGVTQAVVGAVLPARHDPLVQQLLQFQHRPQRFGLQATAPAFDVRAGVAGHELGEQRPDRRHQLLDVWFLCRRAGMGGLEVDPQERAGRAEVPRQEHAALVDHDRLRDDDRPGRGVFEPLVDAGQPPVRQHRPGHRQRLRPARPHRLRSQSPGQQDAGVDRLRGRAQHRCGHRLGSHVDHAGQLHPPRRAVVEQDQHVQGCGVHLHQLTRGEHPRPVKRRCRGRRH
ncbi:hypothetical protein EDC02_5039 [Micromonospora sp. Llam0]|nr:hypothetical protein EDC02_5039 [Micromonospora sp. Llam0]